MSQRTTEQEFGIANRGLWIVDCRAWHWSCSSFSVFRTHGAGQPGGLHSPVEAVLGLPNAASGRGRPGLFFPFLCPSPRTQKRQTRPAALGRRPPPVAFPPLRVPALGPVQRRSAPPRVAFFLSQLPTNQTTRWHARSDLRAGGWELASQDLVTYQRITAVPQARPAPKPLSTTS
jgi:hypothetical protein